MNPRAQISVAALLGGLCLLLLLVLWQQLKLAAHAHPPPISQAADAPAALEQETVETEVSPPMNAYREILERPLFTENRRPPPPPPKVEPVVAPKIALTPPELRLIGIVITNSGRIALLQGNDQKVHRLGEGQVIEHWSVVKIDDDKVRLRQADDYHELMLVRVLAPGGRTGQAAAQSKNNSVVQQGPDSGANPDKSSNATKKATP